MKKFAIVTLMLSSLNYLGAAEIYGAAKGCGRYKIAGIIRKNKDRGILFVVNEKTKSEYNFKPAAGELPKFVAYTDVPIRMEANITKLEATRGEVANPSKIVPMVPDPLNPNLNSGFILINQKKCEK